MMDKLKPCPFCGGHAKLTKGMLRATNEPAVFVICEDCEVMTKAITISIDYAAGEVAKEIWNKRAQDEPKEERVVDILDDVVGNICDEYCKFPDYLSDDALNAKCDECPFERLG